jgi:tetratricopeptide (TPR) repeat protein
MDKKELQKWSEYVFDKWTLPNCITDHYRKTLDDWRTKLIIARLLHKSDNLQPALELIESVLNEKIYYKENDEGYFGTYIEYIDNMAWAYKELGILYWKIYKDGEKGLGYIEEALKIAESIDSKFVIITRGDIFRDKLELLKDLGREEDAISEANNIISFIDMNIKNSYLFNAYEFKAQCEKEKGMYEDALSYLNVAYDIYFYDESEEHTFKNKCRDILERKDISDERKFNEIQCILEIHETCWDI